MLSYRYARLVFHVITFIILIPIGFCFVCINMLCAQYAHVINSYYDIKIVKQKSYIPFRYSRQYISSITIWSNKGTRRKKKTNYIRKICIIHSIRTNKNVACWIEKQQNSTEKYKYALGWDANKIVFHFHSSAILIN